MKEEDKQINGNGGTNKKVGGLKNHPSTNLIENDSFLINDSSKRII